MPSNPSIRSLRAPKPRNPVARTLRRRRGGAHGPSAGALRRSAGRDLQRELHALHLQGP
ncbi:MAG TPA: hypothetical protein VLI72_13885 [Methylibium sp.]|nr:hypothetical protein [Methylibium sp.]